MSKLTEEQQHMWDLLQQRRNVELEAMLDTIRKRQAQANLNNPDLIPCRSIEEEINLE